MAATTDDRVVPVESTTRDRAARRWMLPLVIGIAAAVAAAFTAAGSPIAFGGLLIAAAVPWLIVLAPRVGGALALAEVVIASFAFIFVVPVVTALTGLPMLGTFVVVMLAVALSGAVVRAPDRIDVPKCPASLAGGPGSGSRSSNLGGDDGGGILLATCCSSVVGDARRLGEQPALRSAGELCERHHARRRSQPRSAALRGACALHRAGPGVAGRWRAASARSRRFRSGVEPAHHGDLRDVGCRRSAPSCSGPPSARLRCWSPPLVPRCFRSRGSSPDTRLSSASSTRTSPCRSCLLRSWPS